MADDTKKSLLEAALDKAYEDRISHLFSLLCGAWTEASTLPLGKQTEEMIDEAEEMFRIESTTANEVRHSIRRRLGVGTKKSTDGGIAKS